MKCLTIAAIIILLITLLSGCKKEKSVNASLPGSWDLLQVTGQAVINYPRSTGNTLQFTNNGYQRFSNNVLVANGSYTIVKDNSVSNSVCLVIPADQFQNRIIYDGNTTSAKIFLEISNDTLRFVSGCFVFDGASFTTYVRN